MLNGHFFQHAAAATGLQLKSLFFHIANAPNTVHEKPVLLMLYIKFMLTIREDSKSASWPVSPT